MIKTFFLSTILLCNFAYCSAFSHSSNFSHPDDNPEIAKKAQAVLMEMNTEGKWKLPELKNDILEPCNTESKNWAFETYPVIYENKAHMFRGLRMQKSAHSIPSDNALKELLSSRTEIEPELAAFIALAISADELVTDNCARIKQKGKMPTFGHASKDEIYIFNKMLQHGEPFSDNQLFPLGSIGYVSHVGNCISGSATRVCVVCVGRNTKGYSLFMGFDPKLELFSKPCTFIDIQKYLYVKSVQYNLSFPHKSEPRYKIYEYEVNKKVKQCRYFILRNPKTNKIPPQKLTEDELKKWL